MIGMTVEFKQKVQVDTDELNNPIYDIVSISINDCLIAPMFEPKPAREHLAKDQVRDEIRIHLPKTFTGDISPSYIAWSGKIFYIDSGGSTFMSENTPGRWNRYLLAESVGEYDENDPDTWLHFFVTEDSQYVFTTEDSQHVLALESA